MPDMTMDSQTDPQMGLPFEQVWAALMESRRESAESRRLMKESGAEFDRRMKKSEREFNKKFGHLENRFGELAEHLVAPNIVTKFNALGHHFNDVSKERKFYHDDGTIAAEFDILLENGET